MTMRKFYVFLNIFLLFLHQLALSPEPQRTLFPSFNLYMGSVLMLWLLCPTLKLHLEHNNNSLGFRDVLQIYGNVTIFPTLAF